MSLESVNSTPLDTPYGSTAKTKSSSSSSRRELSKDSRSEKKRKLPDSEKVSVPPVRMKITAPSEAKPKKDIKTKDTKPTHVAKAKPAVDKAKPAVEKAKQPNVEKVKPISCSKETLS